MNRRAFLSGAALAIAMTALPLPASASPVTISGQVIVEDILADLPIGSTVRGCEFTVTRPLPLGLHYFECVVHRGKNFKGEAVLFAPPPRNAWERHLQDNTSLIGCHLPRWE